MRGGAINASGSGHTPFRGAKGTTWEGGMRASYIAAWPGMIKKGRTSDGPFGHESSPLEVVVDLEKDPISS